MKILQANVALSFILRVWAQDIDFAAVNRLPDPTYTITPGLKSQIVSYTQNPDLASWEASPTAAPQKRSVLRFERRSACDPQPTPENRYNITADPVESFLADPTIASIANSAPIPPGYNQTFANLHGSSSGNGFLGYTQLRTYDTASCASRCNETDGCAAFNIFFERDPSLEPGFNSCRDPAGFANILCTYWGGPVSQSNSQNTGQWRADFHVVIAGSNGYVLTATPSVFGYAPADPLQTRAINAPSDCNGHDTYMGMRLFNDGAPFDAARCAQVCAETSQYNLDHPPPGGHSQLCKFYNTFILAKNGVNQGQYCAMYSQYWDPSIYGTNTGQYDGQGNRYTIQYSFTFANMSDTGTPICPSDIAQLQSSGGLFCTSYINYTPPITTTTVSNTRTTTSTTVLTVTTTQPANRKLKARQDNSDRAEIGVYQTIIAVYPNKSNDPLHPGQPTLHKISDGVTMTPDIRPATPEPTTTPAATMPSARKLRIREVGTPAVLSGHSFYEISSACSQVATGRSTATVTSFSTTTLVSTSTATSTATTTTGALPSACSGVSPTVIAGSYTNNPSNIDDSVYSVNLPFTFQIPGLRNGASSVAQVTSNGILTFGSSSSTQYSNSALPAGAFAYPTVMGYWDDLYLFAGYPHYISWWTCGAAGNRQTTFEWHVAHIGQPTTLFHWRVTIYEAVEGQVGVHYFSTTDKGSSGTIGFQEQPSASYPLVQICLNANCIPDNYNILYSANGTVISYTASVGNLS